MASDDVIELGSSDEETAPAQKKKKCPVNATVQIPNKLPGITITPSKSTTKINPVCIQKGLIGKSVTVTKISKNNVNTFINSLKANVKSARPQQLVKIPVDKRPVPIQRYQGTISSGIKILNSQINNGNPSNNNTAFKSLARNSLGTVAGGNALSLLKIIHKPDVSVSAVVKRKQTPNNIKKNLPPNVTIKRTLPANNKPNISSKRIKLSATTEQGPRRGAVKSSNRASKVLAVVDLDDDEPTSASSLGPQWYMRPEEPFEEENCNQILSDLPSDPLAIDSSKQNLPDKDQQKHQEKSQKQSPNKTPEKSTKVTTPSELEVQNNKEPDTKKYIEITIEDSPIKPSPVKKGFRVGAELAITIDDSPIKNTAEKAPSSNSDDETAVPQKEHHSKKKLEYPKIIEMVETVEIEFEPLPVEESTSDRQNNPVPSITDNTEGKIERHSKVVECLDVVEIEESPIKFSEAAQTTTPKKREPAKPDYKINQNKEVVLNNTETNEFNPTYQKFIDLCFQMENSEDMKKIVEKKIKAYYRQVPKDYTNSENFIDMVASKIMAIKAGPEKMYLYIKDIVDELNLQRKMAKAQLMEKEAKKEEQEKFLYGEESEFDIKRQRQICKLEKTLKKLHRAIQKLEEQEVDFDDDEDSVYLLTESGDDTSKDSKPLSKEALIQRYKERMVRVHAKLCQLTNTKMPSEPRVLIEARPGQPKGPAKRLEKWINRKVPIGTPLPFPDFHDVLCCVREANQEDKLGWNEADIIEEARDLFTRCGKKLQRRRQENEWRLAASRIPGDVVDPAEESTELKRKLEENKQMAAKKEIELFNKYADRQNKLRLEAVEIGDKEAEESPVESDDEDLVDDTDSMTNKKKRKERLKRLLHEKSKKVSTRKEGQPDHQSKEDEFSKNGTTQDVSKTKISENSTEHEENKDKESKLLEKFPQDSKLPDELPDERKKESAGSDLGIKNQNLHNDNVHTLSDDSNEIESDIDELHLLQKLYSENECNNSVVESSDESSSAIAISDASSIDDRSSSDELRTEKKAEDVISIENSSYSEAEETNDNSTKDLNKENCTTKTAVEKTVDVNKELEYSNNGVGKICNKINSEEHSKCLEDVLLASSEDSHDKISSKSDDVDMETCVNLKDDSISIGETVIEENRKQNDESNAHCAYSIGMEIAPMEVNLEDQNGLQENVTETISLKSTDEGNTTKEKSSIADHEVTTVETSSLESTKPNNDNLNTITHIESDEIDNPSTKTNIESTDNTSFDGTIENVPNSESGNLSPKNVIDNDGNTPKTCTESNSNKLVDSGNKEIVNEETDVKPTENVASEKTETVVKPAENIKDNTILERDKENSIEIVKENEHSASQPIEAIGVVSNVEQT